MAGRDRRRRRTALLISLLFHTALLAPLLLVAPRLRTAQTPTRATMRLGLVPEAGLGIATHLTPPGSPVMSQAARTPPAAQQTSRPQLKPLSATTALPAPAAHAAASAAPASPAATSGAPAAATSGANPDAVRRALQAALACAPGNAPNLDAEGRAACGKRLREAAAAMGEAKVDTIPPEKRAYYDAVLKAYQDIRHYGTPDTILTHLPGAEGMADARISIMPGRPPGPGCGLKFGGPKGAKPERPPPHSLHFNLGPLTCVLTPPQGVLTEESVTPNGDDIPPN